MNKCSRPPFVDNVGALSVPMLIEHNLSVSIVPETQLMPGVLDNFFDASGKYSACCVARGWYSPEDIWSARNITEIKSPPILQDDILYDYDEFFVAIWCIYDNTYEMIYRIDHVEEIYVIGPANKLNQIAGIPHSLEEHKRMFFEAIEIPMEKKDEIEKITAYRESMLSRYAEVMPTKSLGRP